MLLRGPTFSSGLGTRSWRRAVRLAAAGGGRFLGAGRVSLVPVAGEPDVVELVLVDVVYD